MSDKGKILIISPENQLPESLTKAITQLDLTCEIRRPPAHKDDRLDLSATDAVILNLNQLAELEQDDIRQCTDDLKQLSLQTLVLTKSLFDGNTAGISLPDGMVCVDAGESAEMLKGRLVTIMGAREHLQVMNMELQQLRMLNGPLNSHFTQVDEEMRLAARLQRDFLPRNIPQFENVRFATIFRPATWVSGDIFDIIRLDEHHIGFYIADVVGHGMPAALLTIFIKRALVTKTIQGHNYNIISPGEALKHLNDDLVTQDLSNFQFATCCYAVLNTQTLQLQVANAGHPPPMRINRLAQESELAISGPLLGVFADADYETEEFQLHRGDKLLLYSDGVEVAFVSAGPDEPLRFRQECGDLAHCDIKTMTQRLVYLIDHEEGSLHPRDDVTIVGLEIDPPAAEKTAEPQVE
ncbi:MAG: serine/threonine-protein phosphatase [Sedimentisphaerales bacterium]|nr:serine/threonine-protein phosphatase [Sedimentisphaerales bacterium]